MRKFGYAQVSTGQQSLDRQISTLKEDGVKSTRIFTNKISGVKAEKTGMDRIY
jgi:DNA invertase Pin-like site-specific DNA recombinase